MVWLRKIGKRRTFLAISPPSDIVMDVARAAEPADIEAARAALTKRAGGVAGTFSVDTSASVEAGSILSRASADHAASADPAKKFKKFEAMVLQTFIQNMLPKDTEGVYGSGLAGDMWKSQLAERVADVMADRGGIGIAKSLLADHYMDGKRKVPIGPVSNGPEKTEIDQQTRLSTSLVQELQRKAARSMTGDDITIKTDIKI
ncbi:MAG: rod-binding protein [Mesorhizobium sp.]|uniref:rod-binding protein n=1 Tax=Mesorhizobium sp. TaxID=1871066 RepID=UPI001AC8BA40|nr:rod-binding protein [Mesorhizobium sp.]MBN9221211.1 rod-binding protein [Mesorhizobium sp.]